MAIAGNVNRISVDRSQPLAAQPQVGHNRWHPDIPPVLRVAPGERVVLETLDALDGQVTPHTTIEEVGKINLDVVHPLTGPVYVNGAEPGDVLEIQIVDVEPAEFGFTTQIAGFGFLRDLFDQPYIVHWSIADGYATAPELPGVRIPGASFPGVIGLAPSHELLQKTIAREQALAERGGVVLTPNPTDAVPNDPRIAAEALRTIPPRETGGNLDVKQLSKGVRLAIPVSAPGALFSIGDAHFAQGDGECCGTAIEMCATFHLEFQVHKGLATKRNMREVQFARDDYYGPAELIAPRRFYATTGMSIESDGTNRSEDATLAARNALLNMIDYLGHERGLSRQQAYALASVAVDLKLSQVVDVPNFVVTAFLPLDIFV